MRPQLTILYKLKIALSIFLPLAILINSFLWILYYQEIKTRKDTLQMHAVNMTNMQRVKIGSNFRLIVSDLLFFAGYKQLQDMLDNSKLNKEPLINDLALFNRGSKIYDQIRILDTTGMEIIRIEFEEGASVIVPKDPFQFKGNRYYFKDTFELNRREVFVSPLDLNIEHGVIEKPLKPMIRFGTPLFDKRGQKRGVLIYNYLGTNLIRNIKDMVVDSPGFYMLLNADGYWIIGRDTEDEWGFMYRDRKNRTMGNIYPAAWKKISASESGQFYNTEGLFTFTTVYPLLESWKSSAGSGEAFEPSAKTKETREYYWKVVSYIPKNFLIGGTNKSLSKYIYISIMMIMLLGIGSWLLAYSKVKQNITAWELAERTNELEQTIVAFQRKVDRFGDEIGGGFRT